MDQTVAPGRVVLLRYTLFGEDGAVLERTGDGVMPYLHGHGNLIAGLETALEGKAAGDRLEVTVPPEQGYGLRTSAGPQAVPRKEFPRDAHLAPGTPFRARGTDGTEVVLYVTKVAGSRVYVDTDHPFAGMTLRFDVEVAGVRGATPDELRHGHAHGVSGEPHHH